MAEKRKRSQKIDPDKNLKSPFLRAFLIVLVYMKYYLYLLFVVALAIGVHSCKKDNAGKLTPSCDGSHPTYQTSIKSIIDTRCATSNCHPNYASYDGLLPALQGGDFRREVLVNQTMPQGASLTQDQINKIQCWVNDGFPEN